MQKNFLFITRKYPPIIGGMENLSYDITTRTAKKRKALIVANRKGNRYLPLFMITSFFRSFFLAITRKIDVVHLGDPVMFPVGLMMKLFRKKVFVEIHGLDVTFENRFYQRFVVRTVLPRFDGYICISEMAKKEAVSRGVDPVKCAVIPIGIENKHLLTDKTKEECRDELSKKIGVPLEKKEVLITVGRLVKRKGALWFVENVMPKLKEDRVYVIVGGGEDLDRINGGIRKKGLEKRVFALGRVSDDLLRTVYNAADLFIMPNIPVKGDMEGFGIVAIEASSIGLPVIASGIEGIRDAISDGNNGMLLEPYDTDAYVKAIGSMPSGSERYAEFSKKSRDFTKKTYDWDRIIDQYIGFMEG